MKKLLLLLLIGMVRPGYGQNSSAYKTLSDIHYRSEAEQSSNAYIRERCVLDLYYPEGQKRFATVVWFHGGGLTGGSKYIPDNLKKQGIAVVAVNYRLSPRVSSPAYLEDAAAAVAWVLAHIGEYGGDRNLVFVSGHSAGGYLTNMLALDKKWLAAFGADADSIAGYIPFSGQQVTHFTIRAERKLPPLEVISDEMSPMAHVRKNLPPFFMITGERDHEFPGRYEENALMCAYLKNAGNKMVSIEELNGFDHNSMVNPACYLLLKHMKEVIKAHQQPVR